MKFCRIIFFPSFKLERKTVLDQKLAILIGIIVFAYFLAISHKFLSLNFVVSLALWNNYSNRICFFPAMYLFTLLTFDHALN